MLIREYAKEIKDIEKRDKLLECVELANLSGLKIFYDSYVREVYCYYCDYCENLAFVIAKGKLKFYKKDLSFNGYSRKFVEISIEEMEEWFSNVLSVVDKDICDDCLSMRK